MADQSKNEIVLGEYTLIQTGEKVEVEEIIDGRATLWNKNTNFRKTKTINWCKKNLEKVQRKQFKVEVFA